MARVSRLPRKRGDGPSFVCLADVLKWAPPQTRGWTPAESRPGLVWVGSPANAGMDLIRSPAHRQESRLPRKRGDGPLLSPAGGSLPMAPPQTRGWTRDLRLPVRGRGGSPANAGMDLSLVDCHSPRPRLPRKRGDGPVSGSLVDAYLKAPPQTRGWTCGCLVWRSKPRGSPANAGMDPGCLRLPHEAHRLPRKRGDGPVQPLAVLS